MIFVAVPDKWKLWPHEADDLHQAGAGDLRKNGSSLTEPEGLRALIVPRTNGRGRLNFAPAG